jgi:hypothetical protein
MAPKRPEGENVMKKNQFLFVMMVVSLAFASIACIEDGALPLEETLDATVPTSADASEMVDATPPTPDATVVNPADADTVPVPDAMVPDASVPPPVMDASAPTPDAMPATPDAAPVLPDACTPPPPACVTDSDCNDGFSWTGDACSSGNCVHWATDCGGMQVRPAIASATCEFWAGFGVPEPALSLGLFSASGLPTGPSGGSWKAAPAHACSVICYNPGLSVSTIDIQIEWNGLTLQHQEITGLKKGTWDGHNLLY